MVIHSFAILNAFKIIKTQYLQQGFLTLLHITLVQRVGLKGMTWRSLVLLIHETLPCRTIAALDPVSLEV